MLKFFDSPPTSCLLWQFQTLCCGIKKPGFLPGVVLIKVKLWGHRVPPVWHDKFGPVVFVDFAADDLALFDLYKCRLFGTLDQYDRDKKITISDKPGC
jgi:hypothetical protein